MRGLLAQDSLLTGLPIPPSRTVACSVFVSHTVARQLGIRTPFRFAIPGLVTRSVLSYHTAMLSVMLRPSPPSSSFNKALNESHVKVRLQNL